MVVREHIQLIDEGFLTEPLLRAVQVARVYGRGEGRVHALRNVNLEVTRNRLIALRGRSGSGKTTLLNLLGALDNPSVGRIYFAGQEITRLSERARSEFRRRNVGFVFQSFGLVPHMTVQENVAFGLRVAGVPKLDWTHRVSESLERVGLNTRAKHRPYELSGGEQQRCAIARAMVHRPLLILADESTAELDSKMGMSIMLSLKALVRDHDITVVMTTHDPVIMEVADCVYALENGEVSNDEVVST